MHTMDECLTHIHETAQEMANMQDHCNFHHSRAFPDYGSMWVEIDSQLTRPGPDDDPFDVVVARSVVRAAALGFRKVVELNPESLHQPFEFIYSHLSVRIHLH